MTDNPEKPIEQARQILKKEREDFLLRDDEQECKDGLK